MNHFDARTFLAYYRSDGVEGVEFSCSGEDLPSFFERCVLTFVFDILIIYSCSSAKLTEEVRIDGFHFQS